MNRIAVIAACALLGPTAAPAGPIYLPPPFVAGIPGRAQAQAVELQRHQARTLLYREALEELRRNPEVVNVRECADERDDQTICLPRSAAAKVPDAVARQPVRRRIALLVGNNHYLYPIPPLETPIRDIGKMARLLQRDFGFEVRTVENATKADLVRAVAALARDAGMADSVLIYYAGHGYLMDDTGMGYWILSDGSVKTAAQWVSNTDITKLLGAIPARQLLLVSDSCFSGTLARGPSLDGSAGDGDVLGKRSVVVLSSGGEEPVSDEGKDGHSIFAWHLLRTLAGVTGTQAGAELHRTVRKGVSEDYPQRPEYGAVMSAGHQTGGDYLFSRAAE